MEHCLCGETHFYKSTQFSLENNSRKQFSRQRKKATLHIFKKKFYQAWSTVYVEKLTSIKVHSFHWKIILESNLVGSGRKPLCTSSKFFFIRHGALLMWRNSLLYLIPPFESHFITVTKLFCLSLCNRLFVNKCQS